MKHAFLFFFVFFVSVVVAKAYDSPDPPDYAAIFNAADLVVMAQVDEVILPRKRPRPTEVVLKIQKVYKGDIKRGDLVRVFHDSGEVLKIENGIVWTEHAFRCPAFPRFEAGEKVMLYAEWDAKKKRYFVPGYGWKVTQKK